MVSQRAGAIRGAPKAQAALQRAKRHLQIPEERPEILFSNGTCAPERRNGQHPSAPSAKSERLLVTKAPRAIEGTPTPILEIRADLGHVDAMTLQWGCGHKKPSQETEP
eukprot:4382671-Pyramimonas_sp.AAC.1